ncbi:MAG: hypothetical protein A2X46_06415 [Lentisphaerae bacterium GWF2_57_35]|nr:MAG: hypothetical protein A2X46_06415 [Lentisphaerae bacterium GWF2_57_35]
MASLLPWILGAAAFIAYFITRSQEITGGVSAQILNAICDLYYIPSTLHLPYIYFSKMLNAILPGSMVLNTTLISAAFGALCVVLFYKLMTFAPLYDSSVMDAPADIQRKALEYGAVLASLLLIFALPFWLTATAPSHIHFDTFLLLLCFYLALRYSREKGSRKGLFFAVFLYGLGMTENALMIGLAPLFVTLVLYVLFRRGEFSRKILLTVAALGLLGLMFYLVPPFMMSKTPDYGYGEFGNFWTVLVDLWRKQYRELKGSLPSVGGLLILLTTLAPWGYALFVPKHQRTGNSLTIFFTTSTLLVLNALGLILLLEIRFSPMNFLGQRSSVILSYMLIASWVGYLGGYWLLKARLSNSKTNPFLRIAWGCLAFLQVLAPIAIWNANRPLITSSRPYEFTRYAQDIILSCKDKSMLFTAGLPIDDLLRFFAREQGWPKVIVNSTDLDRASYQRYLAAQLNIPEIASTNIPSTIERAKTMLLEPDGRFRSAAFMHPDMISSLGYQSIPNGLVALPIKDFTDIDATAVYAHNMKLLDGPYAETVQKLQVNSNAPISEYLLREYSRSANNLGVTLRMLKNNDLALKAFEAARTILPNNPSALMNMRGIYIDQAEQLKATDPIKAERSQEKAKKLLAQAFEESQRLGPAYKNPMLMASHYGAIYSAAMSLLIAQSSHVAGFTDLESSAIEQARLINPESTMVQASSALFNLGQGNLDEAEDEYHRILAKNPNDIRALIGSAAVAYTRGHIQEAINRLTNNAQALSNASALSFLALLHVENKDPVRSLEFYNQAVARTNQTALTSAFLASTAFQLARWNDAEKFANMTVASAPNNVVALKILADLAERKGDVRLMQERLERLQKVNPTDIRMLEKLTSLYLQQKQESRARATAQTLLELDSNNIIANQTLALLSNIPEVQEKYMRRAVSNTNHPIYVFALNNLAYILIQQTNYSEALPLAENAVRIAPNQASFYHTLATAYFGTKQYEKAVETILTACTLDPKNSEYKLLYGGILNAMGQSAKARELISQALPDLQGQNRSKAISLLNEMAPAR